MAKVDFSAASEVNVVPEVQQVDAAMERILHDLLEGQPTRGKLVTLASEKLDAMNSGTSHYELREQLRADVASADNGRMVHAITHLNINSDAFAQLIREELAELTGERREIRKLQFSHSLDAYQAAKSNLAGAWLSATALFALHYTPGVPTRDMLIAGLSGLAKAIEKYDSNWGFKFGRYAPWWIRQSLTRAAIDLRGWTLRELEIRSEMRKLIGKDKWEEWAQSPNPADVAVMGLGIQEIVEIIERSRDETIYPIRLRGRFLTPECAGEVREWVQLSENVTSESNPIWWV